MKKKSFLTLVSGGRPPSEPPTGPELPECPDFHSEGNLLTAIAGLTRIVTLHALKADTIDDPGQLDTLCCALLELVDSLDDKLGRI